MPANPIRHRVAAFALAAFTLALASPAPVRPGPATHGFDLCVAGKLVPAAPAGSTSTTHDCDRCCGSAPAAVGPGPVAAPPLRDRPEDIALLAQARLKESPTPVMIDKGALDYLTEQRWPGNVRELKNVLVRAAALAQDGIIRRGDVIGDTADARKAPDIDFLSKFSDAKDKAIERFERAYLEALMRRTAGNLSKASREADIARHHLRDLLKKRGLYNISFGESE
jgi:hypothetical protein